VILPVLRGSGRNVKQAGEANVAFLPRSSASAGKTDSEANAVSGEVSEANASRLELTGTGKNGVVAE
jgi:hypothetical protein